MNHARGEKRTGGLKLSLAANKHQLIAHSRLIHRLNNIRRLRLRLRSQSIGLTGRWVEAYGSESRLTQMSKAQGWKLKAIRRLSNIRRLHRLHRLVKFKAHSNRLEGWEAWRLKSWNFISHEKDRPLNWPRTRLRSDELRRGRPTQTHTNKRFKYKKIIWVNLLSEP